MCGFFLDKSRIHCYTHYFDEQFNEAPETNIIYHTNANFWGEREAFPISFITRIYAFTVALLWRTMDAKARQCCCASWQLDGGLCGQITWFRLNGLSFIGVCRHTHTHTQCHCELRLRFLGLVLERPEWVHGSGAIEVRCGFSPDMCTK